MTLAPASPVLALPGRTVQVGLAAPTILRRLTRAERDFVASLEGGQPVSEADSQRHSHLISRLTRAGLWNTQPRRPVRAAVGGDPTLSGGAASILRAMGVRVRREPGSRALTIIAGLATADPALIAPLTASSIPHIAILADDAGAWVSHVIVPGVTACTRCRDVARTRANPSWPVVAMQCVGRRPQLTPLAESVAVARAAARALAWLDADAGTGSAESPGTVTADVGARAAAAGTGERVDARGAVTPEPLPPEPECGCGAAGPVGDEVAARRARWR